MDMAQRMKWTHDGASLIQAQPRPGAWTKAIDEPQSSRREHVHLHLRAAKVADQAAPAGGLPSARRDQNTEPEEAGFLDRSAAAIGRRQGRGRSRHRSADDPRDCGYGPRSADRVVP
jgi:hypothetical protein